MGGPLPAQSADLHTLWKVKQAGKRLCDWGSLTISDEGCPVWQRGGMWFSLCQFRDNVVFASCLRPATTTDVVHMVADTLFDIWSLEVLCPCVKGTACSRRHMP